MPKKIDVRRLNKYLKEQIQSEEENCEIYKSHLQSYSIGTLNAFRAVKEWVKENATN